MKFKVEVDGIEVFIPEEDTKYKPMIHHELGLTYTATGYGTKLPTRWMIYFQGIWRRVYAICISNVSTAYVLVKGEKLIVREC